MDENPKIVVPFPPKFIHLFIGFSIIFTIHFGGVSLHPYCLEVHPYQPVWTENHHGSPLCFPHIKSFQLFWGKIPRHFWLETPHMMGKCLRLVRFFSIKQMPFLEKQFGNKNAKKNRSLQEMFFCINFLGAVCWFIVFFLENKLRRSFPSIGNP